MRIYYKDSDGNKTEIGGWVQTVETTSPLDGVDKQSVDPPKSDNSDNFPYYDSKDQFAHNSKFGESKGVKQDAFFYDEPKRDKSVGNFNWTAETSLIGKKRQENIPIMTLKWGFNQNRTTSVKVVTPSVFHKNAINQIPKK